MTWLGVAPEDVIPQEQPAPAYRFIAESPAAPSLSFGLLHARGGYRTTRTHGDSCWLLMLTAGGRGVVRYGDRTHRVGPHTATLYHAGPAQDYGIHPDAEGWVFAFAHARPRPLWSRRTACWPRPWADQPGVVVLPMHDPRVWREAWTAMTLARRLWRSPQRNRAELATSALEAAILWCDEASAADGPLPDPRIRRAAEFAHDHADRAVTADELAAAAGLSPSRLTALFREQFGESPVGYAERLRLERVATLIALGGLRVKEAAAAAGYADPYHFSRRFSRRMGVAPSAWRG